MHFVFSCQVLYCRFIIQGNVFKYSYIFFTLLVGDKVHTVFSIRLLQIAFLMVAEYLCAADFSFMVVLFTDALFLKQTSDAC